ncbi:ATP-binding protein [Streptomyces sp. NPDC050625]|uniref:ATP-binding protein n=1 Tax=Streptomyces sp. NPDC050625 TaxID=3154629 RepID=UPI0034428806
MCAENAPSAEVSAGFPALPSAPDPAGQAQVRARASDKGTGPLERRWKTREVSRERRVQRHDLRAVADVRRFLRAQARSWDWDAVSPDLELAVTELVTNGLVHADSEVEVRLREYPDRLRVDVRDSDPRPPLPTPVLASGETDSESEHGRGLLIVDALATSWGNSPSGRGKSVWFELTRP